MASSGGHLQAAAWDPASLKALQHGASSQSSSTAWDSQKRLAAAKGSSTAVSVMQASPQGSIPAVPRPPSSTRQHIQDLRKPRAAAEVACTQGPSPNAPHVHAAAGAPYPSVPNIVLYPPPHPQQLAQGYPIQQQRTGHAQQHAAVLQQEAMEVLGTTVDDLDQLLYPGQQPPQHNTPTRAELDSLIRSEQQALTSSTSKGHLEQHAPGRPAADAADAADGVPTAQEVQAMLPEVEGLLRDVSASSAIAVATHSGHRTSRQMLASAAEQAPVHPDSHELAEASAMVAAYAAQQLVQQSVHLSLPDEAPGTTGMLAAQQLEQVTVHASPPAVPAGLTGHSLRAPAHLNPSLQNSPSFMNISHLDPSTQDSHHGRSRRWLQTPEPHQSQHLPAVSQQLPLPLPLPPQLPQPMLMPQPPVSRLTTSQLRSPSTTQTVAPPRPPPASPHIPQLLSSPRALVQAAPQSHSLGTLFAGGEPATPVHYQPQPPDAQLQGSAALETSVGPTSAAPHSPQEPTTAAQLHDLHKSPSVSLQASTAQQARLHPHPPLPPQHGLKSHPPCEPQPQQALQPLQQVQAHSLHPHPPQPQQLQQLQQLSQQPQQPHPPHEVQPQLPVRPWLRASLPNMGSAGLPHTPVPTTEQSTVRMGSFLQGAASMFRTLVTGPMQRINTMRGTSTSDSGVKPAMMPVGATTTADMPAVGGSDLQIEGALNGHGQQTGEQAGVKTGRTRRGSVLAVLTDSLMKRAATDAGILSEAGITDDPGSPLPTRALTTAGLEVTFKSVPVLRHPDSIRKSRTTEMETATPLKSRRSSMLAFFGVGSKAEEEHRSLHNSANRSRQSRRASLMALLTGDLSAAKALITGHMDPAAVASRAMTPANSRGRRSSVIEVISSMLTAKTETLQVPEEELVFTSLDDFRPINFKYKQTENMRMYFACAKTNGIHYILRKYGLQAMDMAATRSLRSALAISGHLSHPGLLRIRGHWETDDAMYVVEDLAKTDLMSDSLAHPEKYTEAFVVCSVVKPLLTVLAYLHSQHIIHRAIQPNNLLISRTDKLLLTNYSSMLHALEDQPDRVNDMFLDYMAPEVVSLKTMEARIQESQRFGGSGASVHGARRRAKRISRAASQGTLGVPTPRSQLSPGCSPRHAPPKHASSSGCEHKSQLSRLSTAAHSLSAGDSPIPGPSAGGMLKSNSQEWLGSDMLIPVRDDFVHSFIEKAQSGTGGLKSGVTGISVTQQQPVAESRLPVVSGGYEPLLPTINSQLPLEMGLSPDELLQREGLAIPAGLPPESPYVKMVSRFRTSEAGSEPPSPYVRGRTVSIAGDNHPGADDNSHEDSPQKLQASRPSVIKMLMQPFRKQQERSSYNSQSSRGFLTSMSGMVTRTHSATSRTQASMTSAAGSPHAGQLRMVVRQNPWEWQDEYNEKLDIWQVGCLVHELLCGCLPFETSDPRLCSALIMWADLQVFPEDLSPQAVSFIQACLRKNPAVRPSATDLLHHEWITMHEAGANVPSMAVLDGKPPEPLKGHCLTEELGEATSTTEAIWTLLQTAYGKASRIGCQVRASTWRYVQGLLGLHQGVVGPQRTRDIAGDITTVTRQAFTAYGVPAAKGAVVNGWEVDE